MDWGTFARVTQKVTKLPKDDWFEEPEKSIDYNVVWRISNVIVVPPYDNVTRFGKNSPFWLNLKILWQNCEGLFSIWQIKLCMQAVWPDLAKSRHFG